MAIDIFNKTYHGFEHFSDYWRDVGEAVDKDFNSAMESVPGEFQGKMRVTITYEPAECEARLSAEYKPVSQGELDAQYLESVTPEAPIDHQARIKRLSEIAARIREAGRGKE